MEEFKELAALPDTGWDYYRLWNQALCEHFFGGVFAQLPVYLDLDDRAIRHVFSTAFSNTADPRKHLAEAIVSTLYAVSADGNPFDQHLRIGRSWARQKYPGYPPFVALLSFFSLVAESMVADNDFAPHNYYGRLCRFLSLPSNSRLAAEDGYRRTSQALWPALNTWLTEWDGTLGLPTAKALDHRKYVSLAISQALVRDHDRKMLRAMFVDSALSPGQRLSAPEMKSVLLHWLAGHQGTSVARLVNKGQEIRDRIVELAIAELEAWDGGSEARQASNAAARLSIVGQLRRHPLPRLDLYVAAYAGDARAGTELPLKLSGRADAAARAALGSVRDSLRLEPLPDFGFWSLEPWAQIRAGDAILGNLDLEEQGGVSRRFTRNGAPLCLLSYREREGVFQEISRAPLMERFLVLSHDTVAPRVKHHLERSARPGFLMLQPQQLEGLPSSWTAFLDVQIARHVAENGLECLDPMSESALLLSGGLSLGHDTWHAKSLPELAVASAEGGNTLSVGIRQVQAAARKVEDINLGLVGESKAFDLGQLNLPDGDYEAVVQGGGGRASQLGRLQFRVRSSNTARPASVVSQGRLVHVFGKSHPYGIVSACTADAAARLANGSSRLVGAIPADLAPIVIEGHLPGLPESPGKALDDDLANGGLERETLAETATEGSASCVLRGYHYWCLDPVPPGAERGHLVRARCNGCHMEMWQRTGGVRGPRRQMRQARRAAPGAAGGEAAPTPALRQEVVSYETSFDSANYLRGGAFSSLAALVSSVDDAPWAALEYVREFSALGHIDVELDQQSQRPSKWMLAPTSIVQLDDGEAVLTGWRSTQLLSHIQGLAERLGGTFSTEWVDSRIPRVSINRLNREKLVELCEALKEAASIDVQYVSNPASSLAQSLPPLRGLERHLPLVRAPMQDIEMFDLKALRWRQVGAYDKPGAYRTRWRGTNYLYVAPESVGRDEAWLSDARVAKHLAASESGIALIGYSSQTRTLVAPLGCELPGLLERVAVLCSGNPPKRRDGRVHYERVPESVALQIWRCLVSRG